MSANFVAREIGYNMPDGWSQGDTATNDWFRPLDTYSERLDTMLAEVAEMGFTAIDIWAAHLHYAWATPVHIRIMRDLLKKHGLRPVGYAGFVGGGEDNLRAACQICVDLKIPLLGGNIELFSKDRAKTVEILREFGVQFALENHPEQSAEEVLQKLGTGDEDFVGVAVDTGWFATQKADVLTALKAIGKRLFHLHLKDVLAPRSTPSGFPMADMGHETCRLGEGIVPVKEVVRLVRGLGYDGAIAIEHEPEHTDPRDDCRASLADLKQWLAEASVEALGERKPLRVAIVGCGNIANAYGSQVSEHATVEILGAQDLMRDRAEAFVSKFGGKVYEDLDSVLRDEAVEAVVNLTIHHAHPEVIERCLRAGKHVHTEKPLAMTYPEAKRLADLADDLNLRLSSAPVLWLGASHQTLQQGIKDGLCGKVRAVFAEVNWSRIERWHPNPVPFYEVGPVFDVAGYPLSALTAFFGPVLRVSAQGGWVLKDRRTSDGKDFSPGNHDFTISTLEFEEGLWCRLTCNFYVGHHTGQKGFEVHGDLGSLRLATIGESQEPVYFAPFEGNWRRLPFVRYPFAGWEFGLGVLELADAIYEGRTHRTTGRQAAHVVEVMEAIHQSITDGRTIEISSRF